DRRLDAVRFTVRLGARDEAHAGRYFKDRGECHERHGMDGLPAAFAACEGDLRETMPRKPAATTARGCRSSGCWRFRYCANGRRTRVSPNRRCQPSQRMLRCCAVFCLVGPWRTIEPHHGRLSLTAEASQPADLLPGPVKPASWC